MKEALLLLLGSVRGYVLAVERGIDPPRLATS
jgi:hypothetical protein